MQRLSHRISAGVSERFRALDRRLHIDHNGGSEWIWAVPILSFAGAFALVAVVGAFTAGVTAALYVPMGLIIAVATAGMSVAYMTPEADTPGDDRDDGGQHERPPQPQPTPPRSGWARWLDEWRERDVELPDEPRPVPRETGRQPEETGSPR
jgi:hypothetical protein